jgi:hypothetical protein
MLARNLKTHWHRTVTAKAIAATLVCEKGFDE